MSEPFEYRGERLFDRVHERDDERPFTHRDFERVVAIIRSDDEITNVRDASLAFKGIREQLSIMTKVFATSVAIAIGCFGYLYATTRQTSEAVARIEERFEARFDAVDKRFDAVDKRFDAVDKRFDAIDKRFDALTAAVQRLQPPQKQTSLE
jgi:hypothetical protein